jgi:hypothetical protein
VFLNRGCVKQERGLDDLGQGARMRVFLQLDEPLHQALRNRDMEFAPGFGVLRSTTRPPRRNNDVMAVPVAVAVVLLDLHVPFPTLKSRCGQRSDRTLPVDME